jgi:hypothetical protein
MTHKPLSRFLALILVLTMLLAACGRAPGTNVRTDPAAGFASDLTAALSELQGTVEIRNPDQASFSAAADGLRLRVQGQVRTGADGRLRLDLSSGTVIRLAPNTLFTLQTNQQQEDSLLTRLVVGAGQVWVMLHGGQMEIETPSGVASVRGSYMSVWVDPLTQDVWVGCLEGLCRAENPTAALDMLAGQGAILYSSDPAGNAPPPPPRLRFLTPQDINQFLANNPEAQTVMSSMAATASALPDSIPPASATPVTSCFQLTSPATGSELPADGLLTFDWTDQPGAYKYIITITKPNGAEKSQIVWSSSFQIDAADLPLGGGYRWKVTAYDSNIQPICSSGPWAFTKAESPTPEPPTGCFQLTSPASGNALPASGPVTFSWTEQPDRYKYILTFIKPDGDEVNLISWTNNYTKDMALLSGGGTYQWKVTAYDSDINPICTAGPWTFTKPESPAPTPVADCFQLTGPANASELPASGPVTFTWTEYPNRYKYIISITAPFDSGNSEIVWSNNYPLDLGSLGPAGIYQWQVTAYNADIQPICTAGPWTFTKPASPAPPASDCVTLLTPADRTDFPTPARVEFTWTPHPAAYKYFVTFKPPSTPAVSLLAWTPSLIRYVEAFAEGGTYQWWVTVKGPDLSDICTSQVFTFTKLVFILPTPRPDDNGGGGALFWNRSGPGGAQSTCSALGFSVSTSNPTGGIVKVIYSTNSGPDGNSDPHLVLENYSGSSYGTVADFSGYSGQTIYWRFAIFDGAYTHDGSVFSFSCP